jgi:uncharacterized membrane protein (DUF485 family)
MNPTSEPNWHAIAAMPEFQELLRHKRRFVVPCCIFFTVYYLSLLVLVGWHADWMKKPVWGVVNGAYIFALSQFFMTWIMAFVYTSKAAKFDSQAAEILRKAGY